MGRRLLKQLDQTYGFDEVAIVPGDVTINPEMVSTKLALGGYVFEAPFLASAMDGTVSPRFAALMHEMGGLGVLNAEGLYTRYDDPYSVLEEIVSMSKAEVTEYLQQVYSEPIRENLIGSRVQEIKGSGAVCAVSFTPQNTKKLSPVAVEAGADIVFVQSTVTTARHMSNSYRGLVFSELMAALKVPVVVGNCVSYNVALELMETGVDGILVGVGPGGLHDAGGHRRRRSSSIGDAGMRRGPGRPLPANRPIRRCHHRRRHPHRRRRLQVHRQRCGRRDDRNALCPGGRGAGTRLQLGHGQRPSRAAQRHSH